MKNFNIIIFIVLLGITPSAFADYEELPSQPPGKFILLETDGYLHRMYIDCHGDKTPTVLIDVGIAESSINWLDIMDTTARTARTCIYDRSGYGWSDTGPGARTTSQITKELYNLVKTAHIPGPYVLVGHSFGGFTVRYFAASYPDEIVGAVLIDSSHPEQVNRLAELDNYLAKNHMQLVTGRQTQAPDHLNEMEKKWFHLNSSRKATFAQMDELKYFKKSALQVEEIGPFPEIPLAVLTRSKSQLPEINGKSLENEWQLMQADLVKLSPHGWQAIVENSGHTMYEDSPGTIIDMIEMVVELSRRNKINPE